MSNRITTAAAAVDVNAERRGSRIANGMPRKRIVRTWIASTYAGLCMIVWSRKPLMRFAWTSTPG